jgi:hypothetical protein
MPLLLKSEVPPKTSSAEFCWKLFAADHCCDNFSFGRAAFSQPLFGVLMKSDLHYFATRILIYSARVLRDGFGYVERGRVTAHVVGAHLAFRDDASDGGFQVRRHFVFLEPVEH